MAALVYEGDDGSFEEITPHYCSADELDKFYEPSLETGEYFNKYLHLMMCFDMSKFKIQGDRYATKAKVAFLTLGIPKHLCRNDPYDSECVTTA